MTGQRKTPSEAQWNLSGTPARTETETSIAGGGPSRSSAGEEMDIPQAAQDVVEVEGTAKEKQEARPQQAAITTYLFEPDREPRAATLTDLLGPLSADENFVWGDLSNYIPTDLQQVAEFLHLPRVAVHAALSGWQRPHLDVFDEQFFVTVTLPEPDPQAYRVQVRELDLFVGRNFLLSAHKTPLPFFERVLTRATHNPELLHHDSVFMLYIILDELLAYDEDLNEHLQNQIEVMEERALTDTSDTFLSDLLHFKRYAFAISRLVDQHRDIFTAFLRPDFHAVSGQEVEVYYRDLEAHLSRLVDALVAAKDSINGAFDIYVSHVSHRTNNVMKILTIVSTVLLPTTVILGFFGTNNIQGFPILTQPTGFMLMVASILLISAAILWTFHRKSWL